jgi:hypothetical protein
MCCNLLALVNNIRFVHIRKFVRLCSKCRKKNSFRADTCTCGHYVVQVYCKHFCVSTQVIERTLHDLNILKYIHELLAHQELKDGGN